MQINSNADKIEDISKLYEGKKRKVTISSIVNGLSSVKDKQSEKNKKNENNIKGVINYLNNSNKLPNINKDIDVEFRGFSTEEVEKGK